MNPAFVFGVVIILTIGGLTILASGGPTPHQSPRSRSRAVIFVSLMLVIGALLYLLLTR
jgi:hypothetical protein